MNKQDRNQRHMKGENPRLIDVLVMKLSIVILFYPVLSSVTQKKPNNYWTLDFGHFIADKMRMAREIREPARKK